MRYSRKEQDQILFEIEKTEGELIKLKTKMQNEGLSSPEYYTMQMLENKLKRLRRM